MPTRSQAAPSFGANDALAAFLAASSFLHRTIGQVTRRIVCCHVAVLISRISWRAFSTTAFGDRLLRAMAEAALRYLALLSVLALPDCLLWPGTESGVLPCSRDK